MKRTQRVLLSTLALGGAALLLGPVRSSAGLPLLGGGLSLDQRDFRIYNNFSKAMTNDNVTPDDNFPGALGAVMAIWKGCIEWSSELHGSGNGDPTQQGALGSGGANFDPSFQGEASSVGLSSQNVHSQIGGSAGGVLAYCEGGSGGWRIRYYEDWAWEDGPESSTLNELDLQGVACHEYGHALGLGHSDVGGATMFPTASGTATAQRSIEADDIAGVQQVYGVKSATKPRIHSIAVSGNTLTIQGEDFSATNNQVWFTNELVTSPSTNPFVKVTGVASTGGGTTISVTIPAAAGAGDVLVQKNGTSSSSLSNAWPFDPAGTPPAPAILGIEPASAHAVELTPVLATITGNHLETVSSVTFGGAPVDYTLTADHKLTLTLPTAPQLGQVDVSVQTPSGLATTQISIVANDPPVILNHTELVLAGMPGSFTLGAPPGAIAFLAASPNHTPSVLPGILSADIGAGFTTITLVAAPLIGAGGTAPVQFLTAGLPPLSTVYFQVAALYSGGVLPMSMSNVASVIIF